MIRLTSSPEGEIGLETYLEPPAVYLDHWAFCEVADDEDLREQLVNAIRDAGGTFCFSFANQLEYGRMSPDSRARGEALLDAVLPHVLVLDGNPWSVLEREDALLERGGTDPPFADPELTKHWFRMELDGVVPRLRIGPLFTALEREAVEAQAEELKEVFVQRTMATRRDLQADQDVLATVRGKPVGADRPTSTRALIGELLRGFVLEVGDRRIQSNHAIDFFHAVVPLAYADQVVLDRHWAEQARQARGRLATSGHQSKVARVFAGRNAVAELIASLRGSRDSD